MSADLISLPGNVEAKINVKKALRFNFENNYLKKDTRMSNGSVIAAALGVKGPAIHDIFRGTILSQIYFDLMETSETIFKNFKRRLVDGDFLNQAAAEIWSNIQLSVGKSSTQVVTMSEKFREDISHQRLILWKHYKSLFFALRPPLFRGAFDHVLPGRTPDSYIGQTVQYGQTVIHGSDSTPEPGSLRALRNINHFCGLPSMVVDNDFDFGDESVNIFDEFINIVDSICNEIFQLMNWLVSQEWFDFIDTIDSSMKSLMDELFTSVEHWGDKTGVDLLNSNVYELVRQCNIVCHFLNKLFTDKPLVIKALAENIDERDLAQGEVTMCIKELADNLEHLRCSHIWVVLGFGSHPDTFYHVINPAGFWRSQTDFKHVETPEFWLEKINWESMGAYLKLGWVIFNRVHEQIPFPKATDTLSISTPWRSDEQHIINRELPNRLPSLHKFVTWIQCSFEQCFVQSVEDDGTVVYNNLKWVLFKSGILNVVAFPKGLSMNPFVMSTSSITHGVASVSSPAKAPKGEMRATSAFADDDWEDIQGSIPNLTDFCDKQPPTKVPRTGGILQDPDSAEESEEDPDEVFVAGSLNAVALKAGGGSSRNAVTPKGGESNRQNKKHPSSDFLQGPQETGVVEFGTSSMGFIELSRTTAEVPISTAKSSRIAKKRSQESLSASTGVSSTSSTGTIDTAAQSLVKLGVPPVVSTNLVPTGADNPKITKQPGKSGTRRAR